ncbi:MAG: sulfatase-like hydrolase/transferase [Pseudomonadota bacterium]
MRNVLFIVCDEMARSAPGCYGNATAQTPHIDALAASGVRFSRAITPSPICIPARASLATGLAVHEHGCWSSAQAFAGAQPTWMHRLRDRGADVVSIGKLHYRAPGIDYGFSDVRLPMFVANGGVGWAEALLRSPLPNYPGAPEMAADVGPGDTSYTDYDRAITDDAEAWLRARTANDGPFALSVSLVSPHYPLSAPEAHWSRFEGVSLPAPLDHRDTHPLLEQMRTFWDYDAHFTPETRAAARRNYWALCALVDDAVGRLLAALDATGLRANTDIVFTSDHGDMLGDRGWWAKSVMFDGSVGVPLIVSGPSLDGLRGVCDTAVNLTDIGVTLEHMMTGVSPGQPEQAWRPRSLLDIAREPNPSRPVLSAYHDGGSPCGFVLVQRGGDKLIRYADGSPDQFFDTVADPHELHDRGSEWVPAHRALSALLPEICDLGACDRAAFASQAAVLESLGGEAGLQALEPFNHTPVGS